MSRVVDLHPLEKGLAFTRLAIALALAKDSMEAAEAIAAARWPDSVPHRILKAGGPAMLMAKAAVPGGGTAGGNWAAPLVSLESAAAEFFALVRERSLVGRVAGLRRVPLRTRLVGATSGFVAAWVGEGRAKPISKATYADGQLPSRKVSAMCVVTRELLESVDPAAEALIRNDLAAAVVAAIDASFIDPTNAGEVDVEPPSVTYGAPSTASGGDGLADIKALVAAFPGDLDRAVLIGSPTTFAALHDPVYLPGLGVRGGVAIGIPAIPSKAAGTTLALVDPDGIALGEGTMDLRTSTEGTIEMVVPTVGNSIAAAGVTAVSLWQTDSVAILAEKRLNWEAVRPSVALVTGVAA